MESTNFHHAYNARHTRPKEVAKTFICNSDYEELIRGNHTVLLGPRGCGKTTLMKMLTFPALYTWKDEKAKRLKSLLEFYPVYISTDIYWNAQTDSYRRQLEKFPKYADIVSKVAVTINVLYALCKAFEEILEYEILDNNDEQEIEFSTSLISNWKLDPTIPNIQMIKEGLLKRADELNIHVQKTIFNCEQDSEVELKEEYFFLDYDSQALLAIAAFERIYKIDKDKKWALCFDELELAPLWLQDRLFNSLRSRNQKILYKISTSPILRLSQTTLATSGNDLKLIKMWPHAPGKKYQKFSETLVQSILTNRYGEDISPDMVFGSNPLLRKGAYDEYSEGGTTWKEIKELANEDKELRKLLEHHGINPENPIAKDENKGKLDTVLRKIKPIVYFRNYYSYLEKSSGKRRARSRKAATLFFGVEVLYKISDGNPRWLIGIVNEMLSKHSKGRSSIKVSKKDQAAVFQIVGKQFENIIKTIPEATFQRNHKVYTLQGTLKEVGDYFFKEIVLGPFKLDPHGTFVIDESVSDEQVKVLEKGVYQGAIVLVNPAQDSFDFKLRGKRFRLAYLFSPIFKIPLRKYTDLPLSKCLTGHETISQEEIPFE